MGFAALYPSYESVRSSLQMSPRIPEQKYAVFTHSEHISTIRRTVNTIWNHWLPISGMKAADAPSFERYDEAFDPATGNGGLEIWVPVRD